MFCVKFDVINTKLATDNLILTLLMGIISGKKYRETLQKIKFKFFIKWFNCKILFKIIIKII